MDVIGIYRLESLAYQRDNWEFTIHLYYYFIIVVSKYTTSFTCIDGQKILIPVGGECFSKW